MSTTVDAPTMSPTKNRVRLFRIGLVVGGTMALFNLTNGVGSLIDPTFGQLDPSVPPQPVWMSAMLVVFGAVTLITLVPAWRRGIWAIATFAISRLLEAWSAIVLLFLPGAPEGIATFVVGLILVGTAISLMVAQILWRRA